MLDFSLLSPPRINLSGDASYGPLSAEFTLKFRPEWSLAGKAAEAASRVASGDAGKAVDALTDNLERINLDASGVVRLALPLVGRIPITWFALQVPTTKRIEHPLPGAPTNFPIGYRLSGVIPTPPGTLFDVPALGFGHTQATFNEWRGNSLTMAVLPTISPTAISQGLPLLNKLPIYGYLEYYRVEHVAKGLDLGVRLTFSPSSIDVARALGAKDADSGGDLIQQYQDAKNIDAPGAKRIIDFRIEGRFQLPGGF